MIELITQIVHFLWDIIPRPSLVGPTEEAVCYWFGRYGKVKRSGLYLVWPMIQYWRVRIIVSQICETPVIAVTLADEREWQWRLHIEYEIADLLKYEVDQYSGQNHLEMLGGAALIEVLQKLTTPDMKRLGIRRVCHRIKRIIEVVALERGIQVLDVKSAMASRVRPIFISQAAKLID